MVDAIPPVLRPVVKRALASPDQRYPTVAAFAEALREAAASPDRQERAGLRRSGRLAASIGSLVVVVSLAWGLTRIRPDLDTGSPAVKSGPGSANSVSVSPARPPSSRPGRATKQRKQPVETGTLSSSRKSDSALNRPSRASKGRDSPKGPYISPFRRTHPWAAHPNGRTYFPSSCPLALASSELVYFRSEKEARATGRSRSKDPGCS
jgi:hypothetical protein